MTSSVRKLKGWPPKPGALPSPPTMTELARSRQTGHSVKQLRDEQGRADAADVIQRLLDLDDQGCVTINEATTMAAEGDAAMSKRTRWALHLAIGVLKAAQR